MGSTREMLVAWRSVPKLYLTRPRVLRLYSWTYSQATMTLKESPPLMLATAELMLFLTQLIGSSLQLMMVNVAIINNL